MVLKGGIQGAIVHVGHVASLSLAVLMGVDTNYRSV